MLQKNITLVDYETLTDSKGNRIVAFGHWAGIVGAYNGLLTYGKKWSLFDLKPAYQCVDLEDMQEEFFKVKALPPIKIAITGGGRVANGAMDIMDMMGIKRVSIFNYLYTQFQRTGLRPAAFRTITMPAKTVRFGTVRIFTRTRKNIKVRSINLPK